MHILARYALLDRGFRKGSPWVEMIRSLLCRARGSVRGDGTPRVVRFLTEYGSSEVTARPY